MKVSNTLTPTAKELAYFVENSLASRRKVRTIILKYKLLEYKCKCENPGLWQGKPLTLELDHANSTRNDHRLSNLSFLCPNCHAQKKVPGKKQLIRIADTKLIKDIQRLGSIRKGLIFNGLNDSGANYHMVRKYLSNYLVNTKPTFKIVQELPKKRRLHFRPNTTRINWPTTATLEKLIWEKPMTQLAKELGISDVAIKKHCVRRGLQVPPMGYWAKASSIKTTNDNAI